MAYPNVLYGPEGEQHNTYTKKRWPLGTKMIMQDGREFRFFASGGTAIATGKLCQSELPNANWDELVIPTAQAVGAKVITITNGSQVIVANEFVDGYLNIEDDAGEGHLYRIVANDAEAAGSANFTVTITPGLVEAITTATTVGIIKNPYQDVIIHPSPATAMLVGVTPVAIAANAFGWIQTHGPCSVLIQGTVVINEGVIDSASADGAVAPTASTAAGEENYVGVAMEVAATTEHGLVFLRIE